MRFDDRKILVSIAADCAERVLPIYEKKYPDDKRVRDCIAMCRMWVKGKATDDELRAAVDAAAYAADAAYAAYAAYAAERKAQADIIRKYISPRKAQLLFNKASK